MFKLLIMKMDFGDRGGHMNPRKMLWHKFFSIHITVEGNPGNTSNRKFNPAGDQTRSLLRENQRRYTWPQHGRLAR